MVEIQQEVRKEEGIGWIILIIGGLWLWSKSKKKDKEALGKAELTEVKPLVKKKTGEVLEGSSPVTATAGEDFVGAKFRVKNNWSKDVELECKFHLYRATWLGDQSVSTSSVWKPFTVKANSVSDWVDIYTFVPADAPLGDLEGEIWLKHNSDIKKGFGKDKLKDQYHIVSPKFSWEKIQVIDVAGVVR